MGLFDGDFGDIFGDVGDLFGGGGDAASNVAEAAPNVVGDQGPDIFSQFGDGGAAYSGGGDIPWDQIFSQGQQTPGVNDFGSTAPGFGGGGEFAGATGAASPVIDSAARGTGGPTAGALAGPSGPEEVGYAPGMGPNGPTTPGNPQSVDQAVQYINGQQAPQAGAAPGGDGNFIDRAYAQVQKNPLAALGVGASAIGTGLQMLKPPSGYEKELQDMIAQGKARGEGIVNQGNTLLAPLTSGAPLPAGLQSQILQAQRSREAAARSRAASSGTLNSTMADSQIAQARDQGVADDLSARVALGKSGTDLLSTGLREIGGAESGYGTLMKQQIADDQQFQEALAALSASLGRFGGGQNQPQQPRYYR